MRKILILSLLFVLFSGGAEAEQDDLWPQAITLAEEGKRTPVTYQNGSLTAKIWEQLTEKSGVGYYLNLSCRHKVLSFSFVSSPEDKQLLNSGDFGVKFDNSPAEYFRGYLTPGIPNWIDFGRNHPSIEKAKIHKNMWVLFFIKGRGAYKVKFDITGFSRELAKCSKGF